MPKEKELLVVTGASSVGKSTWSIAFSEQHDFHLLRYDRALYELFFIARIPLSTSLADLSLWEKLGKRFALDRWLTSLHLHFLALQGYNNLIVEGYWYLSKQHRSALYSALGQLQWSFRISILDFQPPFDLVLKYCAARDGLNTLPDNYARQVKAVLTTQRSIFDPVTEDEQGVTYTAVKDPSQFDVFAHLAERDGNESTGS